MLKKNVQNWIKAILACTVMLAVMFLVMFGAWHLFVDTGRAIIH